MKLLSSPAIQFKGTGWYITDYAKKNAVRIAGSRAEEPTKTEKAGRAPATAATATRPIRRRSSSLRGDDVRAARDERPSRRLRSRPTALPAADVVEQLLHIDGREVLRERLGEVRPPQREVHHRLQEPELVARVVADALDLAGVDRPLLEQLAQSVRELDFAGAIASRSPRAPGRCRASGCSGR